jgi:hypothetical protein
LRDHQEPDRSMTRKITADERRAVFLHAILPLLVAASIYLLLLLLGRQLLNDPDSYWHLAVGRWIIEHGTIPTADPLSHTMRGAHWIAFEWLSQLAYTSAYAIVGWWGVTILAAAAIAAAFGLLIYFLLRNLAPLSALILITAALVLTSPHMLARPHVLALPILVLWVGVLVNAVDRSRPPPFAILPLMILWANLHASFTLGLMLIGPIAAEAFWHASRPARKRVAQQWLLFAFLACAAACITPYGPAMFLATYRTIQLGDALSIVNEWQPQDFGHLGVFEIVLLFCIGYVLYRRLTLSPMRILIILGLLHLALSQVRHADILALLGPLFIAAPLASQLEPQKKHKPRTLPQVRIYPYAIVIVGAAITLTAALIFTRTVAPNARNTPSAAIAAGNIANAGPVLNDYAFGGYLAYVGIAPFIDGRAEVYGRDFTLRHHRALNLQNLPDFLVLLDEYRIGATLLAPTTPAVALLDRLPGWRRVYGDEVAVVHRREPVRTPSNNTR